MQQLDINEKKELDVEEKQLGINYLNTLLYKVRLNKLYEEEIRIVKSLIELYRNKKLT